MRNMVTSSVTASEFPLPPGDGQEQLNRLSETSDEYRMYGTRLSDCVRRVSRKKREALYKEIITFYREGSIKEAAWGSL